MADYTVDRRRYPLDSNCAGQVQVTCTACGELFDAGVERVKSPSFLPLCSPECFTCGRFRTHVQRCTGEAAA
jgi:hypothetical protein